MTSAIPNSKFDRSEKELTILEHLGVGVAAVSASRKRSKILLNLFALMTQETIWYKYYTALTR